MFQSPIRRDVQLRDDVGVLGVLEHFARQRDARLVEVVRLADRAGDELLAVLRVDQSRGDADADLVGVAEAVGADVAVRAKQLHEVEVRGSGVEDRQVVLVAIGHVQVHEARLECQQALAARARQALEDQAAVDAQDRRGAGRRIVGAGHRVVEAIRGVAPARRQARGKRRRRATASGSRERRPCASRWRRDPRSCARSCRPPGPCRARARPAGRESPRARRAPATACADAARAQCRRHRSSGSSARAAPRASAA